LILRPADADDLDATWRFRRLQDVSRWLTRAPATFEEYRTQFQDPDSLAKTLVIELDGHVVGDLMLKIEDAWAQAEIADQARGAQPELGWVLHPAHCGRGYGTEAVRELIRLCFEEVGVRRVTANCFAANEASWRVMERVGMRREAFRSGMPFTGPGSGLTAWHTRCSPMSGARARKCAQNGRAGSSPSRWSKGNPSLERDLSVPALTGHATVEASQTPSAAACRPLSVSASPRR
jgi:RimJ/RimL family protein N-acetyltransferase